MKITKEQKLLKRYAESLKGSVIKILNDDSDWVVEQWNFDNYNIHISRGDVKKVITRDQVAVMRSSDLDNSFKICYKPSILKQI